MVDDNSAHPEYGEPILEATPKTGGEPILIFGKNNAQELRDDPDFETEELQAAGDSS